MSDTHEDKGPGFTHHERDDCVKLPDVICGACNTHFSGKDAVELLGNHMRDEHSDTPADDLRESVLDAVQKVYDEKYNLGQAADDIIQLIAQDRAKLLQSLLTEKRTLADHVEISDTNHATYYSVEAVPVAAIKQALQKVTEGK